MPWRELIKEQEALRPPSPWFKGDLQGLEWDQGVKWELGALNCLKHPIFLRARNKTARGGLVKAHSTGRLGELREACREGRSQFGVEDPQVNKARRLLRETETHSRECRKLAVAKDPSLASLSQTMGQLGVVLPRAKHLARNLGAGVWRDASLAWGRETLDLWQVHRPTMQDLMLRADEGAEAYCEAWVSLVLGDSGVVEAGFGGAPTRELLRLPGAGTALSEVLARRWADSVAAAPLNRAPHDGYGVRALEVARVRNSLSELELPQLDSLLLLPGPNRRLGLPSAACRDEGTAIFCPLHQALRGEGLLISKELQSQLERARRSPSRASSRPFTPPLDDGECEGEGAAAAVAPATPGELAARLAAARERLAELLGVDARLLCLRRSPPDHGLVLRLFPSAGQPTAAEAARLLGPGASVEVVHGRGEVCLRELARWSAAGSIASDYYCLLLACSAKLGEAQAAAAREVPLEAAHADAAATFEAADAEATEAGAAWEDAKSSQQALHKLVRQLEVEVSKILYTNISEDAVELVEEAEAKQLEAQERWDEAKELEAQTEPVAKIAFARRDASKLELDERTAALEEAQAVTRALEEEVADMTAKCEALLRTPLAPTA